MFVHVHVRVYYGIINIFKSWLEVQCCNLTFFIAGRVGENTRQSRRVAVIEVTFGGLDTTNPL